MISPLLWFAALGPLALTVAGLALGRADASAKTGAGLATAAASAALVISICAALSIAIVGRIRTSPLGWHGIGLGLYLDALSAVMFVLVAFVGLIVILYSRNYLDSDPGQGRFMRWLCITLAAVLLLIVAGNLFQLLAAWIVTSLSLNKLLLFYPDRQAAVLAARKKFVASRLGDACVLAAIVLIYQAVGSLDSQTASGRRHSIWCRRPSRRSISFNEAWSKRLLAAAPPSSKLTCGRTEIQRGCAPSSGRPSTSCAAFEACAPSASSGAWQ